MLSPELLKTFLKESTDYLDVIVNSLSGSDGEQPPTGEQKERIKGALVNLKGASGMVGLEDVSRIVDHFIVQIAISSRRRMGVNDLRYAVTPLVDALREVLLGLQAAPDRAGTLSQAKGSVPILFKLSPDFSSTLRGQAGSTISGLRATVDDFARHPKDANTANHLYSQLMRVKAVAAIANIGALSQLVDQVMAVLDGIESSHLDFDNRSTRIFDDALDIMDVVCSDRDGDRRREKELVSGFLTQAKLLLPEIYSPPDEAGNQVSEVSQGDIKKELRNTFRIEASEHLAALAGLIVEADSDRENTDIVHQLFRVVHTLKGAAATVDFPKVAEAAHHLENLLDQLRSQQRGMTDPVLKLLVDSERGLRRMVDLSDIDDEDVEQIGKRLIEMIDNVVADTTLPVDSRAADAEETFGTDEAVPTTQHVRVSMEKLDSLMAMILDLQTHRARLDDLIGSFSSLSKKLKWERRNLARSLADFQKKYYWNTPGESAGGSAEFGSLEFDSYSELATLTRTIEDQDFRVSSILKRLESMLERFMEDGDTFAATIGTVRDEMVQVRMVPVKTLFNRLDYQGRALATTLGKKVSFTFNGADTEIDKSIIDAVGNSLMHVIRNCLDHGIEAPEERLRKGKSAAGTIQLSAMREERSVVLRVEDDGAGIDTDRIRRLALERELITAEEAEKLGPHDLMKLIFDSRISTRDKADTISGRGVGMDAVWHTVSEMYGSVAVDSVLDSGTSIAIKLPLTLAVQSILSVRCQAQQFSIPMNYVETILDAPGEKFGTQELSVAYRDGELSLRWLAGYLHADTERVLRDDPVVVLRNGDLRIGLVVDAVTGRDEVIVQQLSPVVSPHPHFLGSTLTSDGGIQLVLNVPFLFKVGDAVRHPVERQIASEERIRVLIADDSLSVRQTIKFMLERHGIKVNTAKDGLLAWQKFHGIQPHILIVDLEMPHLNGYELIERVRQHKDLADTPILVLTSRGGEKHHQKALQAGSDGFLSKPVLERKLLAAIKHISPEPWRELIERNDPTLR